MGHVECTHTQSLHHSTSPGHLLAYSRHLLPHPLHPPHRHHLPSQDPVSAARTHHSATRHFCLADGWVPAARNSLLVFVLSQMYLKSALAGARQRSLLHRRHRRDLQLLHLQTHLPRLSRHHIIGNLTLARVTMQRHAANCRPMRASFKNVGGTLRFGRLVHALARCELSIFDIDIVCYDSFRIHCLFILLDVHICLLASFF